MFFLKPKVSKRPVEIAMPRNTPLKHGGVHQLLPSLDILEAAWRTNRSSLPYAAQGVHNNRTPDFLQEYEWVFAPTPEALVKTVTRWDALKLSVEWYPWAKRQPEKHADWFEIRDALRLSRMAFNAWREVDEEDYWLDRAKRTPDSFRGYWRVTPGAHALPDYDWAIFPDIEPLRNKRSSKKEVARLLQRHYFEVWSSEYEALCIRSFEQADLDVAIELWRSQELAGLQTYGMRV